MLHRSFLVLALVGFSLSVLQAPEAKAQAKKLDLSFVPDDALVAVVAHPRQVLTSPQAAMWPTEVFSIAAKKEVGFDPMEIEQVIGVAGMPQPGGGPPSFGAVVRFRQPVDADAMAGKIVKHGADEKIEGRRARVAISQFEPSLAFADDRTVLIANRESLSWMLTAKAANSPLQKLLQSVDNVPTAAAYAVIEPVRPMVAQAMPMLQQQIPPMFRDVLDLPMTVDNVQVLANMLGDSATGMTLEIKLATADEKAAAGVAAVLKRAMNDVKSMLVAQLAQKMENDPDDRELNAAMLKYTQRMADMIMASLEPKPVGNHAVIKTDLRTGVAEVGVMSALLLPAVQAAREAARRNQSQNNLKQIALSLLNYEDSHRSLPTPATYDANGKPLLSWRVQMLPYLEENALYKEFHLDEPWDSEHNKKLIDKMPAVFKHPNFPDASRTVYQAVVGKGAAFEPNKKLGLRNMTDGTSKTVVVVEVSPEKAVEWTKPEDYEFDPEKGVNPIDFGGLSAGGIFNAVFGDGHVEAISRSVDPEILKALFTRAGGEVVQLP